MLVERRVFGALRMATPRGAGASQSGLTHVTRILFLCHQTSGIRISYPSSTESHLEPSLDYIFLFIQKMDPFQASQIYATTENRIDGTHKIRVRQG